MTAAGFLGNMNRYSVKVGDIMVQLNAVADVTFAQGGAAELDFAFESAIGIPMTPDPVGARAERT